MALPAASPLRGVSHELAKTSGGHDRGSKSIRSLPQRDTLINTESCLGNKYSKHKVLTDSVILTHYLCESNNSGARYKTEVFANSWDRHGIHHLRSIEV